jgi:hypothetical protein
MLFNPPINLQRATCNVQLEVMAKTKPSQAQQRMSGLIQLSEKLKSAAISAFEAGQGLTVLANWKVIVYAEHLAFRLMCADVATKAEPLP